MHWFDVQCEVVSDVRRWSEWETEWPRGEFDTLIVRCTVRLVIALRTNEYGKAQG
jgi:hypothetical protein